MQGSDAWPALVPFFFCSLFRVVLKLSITVRVGGSFSLSFAPPRLLLVALGCWCSLPGDPPGLPMGCTASGLVWQNTPLAERADYDGRTGPGCRPCLAVMARCVSVTEIGQSPPLISTATILLLWSAQHEFVGETWLWSMWWWQVEQTPTTAAGSKPRRTSGDCNQPAI
jgi:hypothetical protein